MNKPATPLPWTLHNEGIEDKHCIFSGPALVTSQFAVRQEDAAYIVAACNAYPRLVAALRHVVAFDQERGDFVENCERARALLRELGEL